MSMAYEPPAPHPGPPGHPGPLGGGGLRCPKCSGAMRTYERNGVHLEQCDNCRGIFLDYGELEALTKIETRLSQPVAPPPAAYPAAPPQAYPAAPPQPYPAAPPQAYPGYGHGPQWGHQGGHYYHRGGLSRLFFSS